MTPNDSAGADLTPEDPTGPGTTAAPSKGRRGGLARYIGARLLRGVPLLLGIVVLNFVLIQFAPGDPVRILVGDFPAPESYVEEIRERYGLDQPLPVQFFAYLGQLVQGDLGFSFANRAPVLELVTGRLGVTLVLMLTAMGLATFFGVILGVVSALRPGGFRDVSTQVVSLTGYSIPDFWLGQILILTFALGLGILPSSGAGPILSSAEGFERFREMLPYLILPAITLSARYLALVARMTRTSVIDVLGQGFIIGARSRGIRQRTILVRHALRNAAAPIVTVIGYDFGVILAGSALVEAVFGWPGIGLLLFDSIGARDYPVMTGILVLVGISVIIVNLVTDLLYALIDPRVRYS